VFANLFSFQPFFIPTFYHSNLLSFQPFIIPTFFHSNLFHSNLLSFQPFFIPTFYHSNLLSFQPSMYQIRSEKVGVRKWWVDLSEKCKKSEKIESLFQQKFGEHN